MLVLSRFKNEAIRIGDDITIVVVEIRGDKVRLGIEAPRDMPVHRSEIHEALKRAESAGEPGEANGGRPEAVGGLGSG